jgi:hypothetical protein
LLHHVHRNDPQFRSRAILWALVGSRKSQLNQATVARTQWRTHIRQPVAGRPQRTVRANGMHFSPRAGLRRCADRARRRTPRRRRISTAAHPSSSAMSRIVRNAARRAASSSR